MNGSVLRLDGSAWRSGYLVSSRATGADPLEARALDSGIVFQVVYVNLFASSHKARSSMSG